MSKGSPTEKRCAPKTTPPSAHGCVGRSRARALRLRSCSAIENWRRRLRATAGESRGHSPGNRAARSCARLCRNRGSAPAPGCSGNAGFGSLARKKSSRTSPYARRKQLVRIIEERDAVDKCVEREFVAAQVYKIVMPGDRARHKRRDDLRQLRAAGVGQRLDLFARERGRGSRFGFIQKFRPRVDCDLLFDGRNSA